MILYDMHDIVIYHACFMAWNGLNDYDLLFKYCISCRSFFVMIYLDEEVHDKRR